MHPRAMAALDALSGRNDLSRTDLLNRAVQVYDAIDAELAKGHELLFRDPATGATRIMVII